MILRGIRQWLMEHDPTLSPPQISDNLLETDDLGLDDLDLDAEDDLDLDDLDLEDEGDLDLDDESEGEFEDEDDLDVDSELEIDLTDRVNGKPVRAYPYGIPRHNWRPGRRRGSGGDIVRCPAWQNG